MLYKNDAGTHFMNSESTCIYYSKLLSDALDARRERFGLHGRNAMLVADAFTGNFGKQNGNQSR